VGLWGNHYFHQSLRLRRYWRRSIFFEFYSIQLFSISPCLSLSQPNQQVRSMPSPTSAQQLISSALRPSSLPSSTTTSAGGLTTVRLPDQGHAMCPLHSTTLGIASSTPPLSLSMASGGEEWCPDQNACDVPTIFGCKAQYVVSGV
jgi:hypothetical protein